MKSKYYRYLWIGWVLAFVGIEWSAMANKKAGDTLSEQWWQVAGTFKSKPNNWQRAVRVGMAGGLGWLAYHFLPGFI